MNANELLNLNDCGCCEGLTLETPLGLDNRPGLSAIAYRIGTHSRFKTSMLARLSDAHLSALKDLMTREDDDFSIALLDAWASVADLLTFYQERIANEAYLLTATERNSVLQLARLIDYRLRPGVAASTYLAFTLEDAQGAPKRATIDIGTKVQSIPGPGEQPQTFETIEQIEARAEWNALMPQTSTLILPKMGDTVTYLKGVVTNLKPGDALLFIGKEREQLATSQQWDFRTVQTVTLDSAAGITRVTWAGPLDHIQPHAAPRVYAPRQRAALFGYNAPDWRAMPDSTKRNYKTPGLFAEYFNGTNLTDRKIVRIDRNVNFDWGLGSPDPVINNDNFSARWSGLLWPGATGSYTFYTLSDDGVRLWVNGQLIINNWTDHGATKEDSGTIWLETGQFCDIRLEYYEHAGLATIKLSWEGPNQPKEIIPSSRLYLIDPVNEWPRFNIAYAPTVPSGLDTIFLDAIYPKIVHGSWLVLTTPTDVEVYRVENIIDDSRSDFTLSAKTSKVRLSGKNLSSQFSNHLRDTVVFGQSEELELAETPLRTFDANAPSAPFTLHEGMLAPIEGDQISLAQFVTGLESGRELIVSGKLMRVRVVTAPRPSEIVPDESWQAFAANAGDSLQAIESPLLQPDGRVRLHLMDKNGFTGIVTTNPANMLLTTAFKNDALVSENVTLQSVDETGTVLTLSPGLKNSFDRATVVIYANVALATNGETKTEVLGGGDASQAYQQFTLKQPPLTYISAATPSGAESTLKIYVNDVQWQEQPALYGAGRRDRIFVTQLSDDGKTTIEFGDGQSGARLPTGRENIKATYRQGLGTSGNVKAGQLSLLMAAPLGVKSVTNPQAAGGGADSEKLQDARRNAPITVLTLDRIVSLTDYEDFARAFAGIAKARATWTWDGQKRGVFVTVAGPNGAAIPDGSPTMTNLVAAMKGAGDPHVSLRVQTYRPAFFLLSSLIDINPDYQKDKVIAAVGQALRDQFSFEAREFGQGVALSEVVSVMQAVPGVVAVDVTKLYRVGDAAEWNPRLPAALPQTGAEGVAQAAELLTLDPGPIDLGVMS